MSGDTAIEFWSEVIHYVGQGRLVRIILTLCSGDRFEIKDAAQLSIAKHVFTVFDESGSKLLFQTSNIVCVDVLVEE